LAAEPPTAERSRRVSLTKKQHATAIGAELLSLCQTATADGSLSQEEVSALREWLAVHRNADLPAISFLTPIVDRIVSDGMVTDEERSDLFKAIEVVLPRDVREMSRTARRLAEKAERDDARTAAQVAKAEERAERDRNRPVAHFDFMIAGAKYDQRPAIIAKHVRVPDTLRLVRDVSNRYSRNAVRVLTEGGHEVGFVPEEDAAELAPLIDAGHPYVAKVKKILSGSTHDIPVVMADLFARGARPLASVERSRTGASAVPAPMPSRLRSVAFILTVLVCVALVFRACSA
jgi:hypothetical protein